MTTDYLDYSPELAGDQATLVDLLRWRGNCQPDRLAYIFLPDGDAEEVKITYKELDRRARGIGALLQSRQFTNQRVLLLYPPGLEYLAAFFGCLYAGAVAVPAYPPRMNRNFSRLRAIVADAQVTAALTTTASLLRIEHLFAQSADLQAIQWLVSDQISDDLTAQWRDPMVAADTLAFLQYTSGSTAAPKGVMVSHANLLHNEEVIKHVFKQTSESIIAGWLPLYHDMGLIGNALQPLYLGTHAVLMSPASFLQRPLRWLQAISRYRASTSGGPNFAYDLCVRGISKDEKATLDLCSWTVAFNGAEPIREDTLDRFSSAFAECGFRRNAFHPCYGLAEATLLVSGGLKSSQVTIKRFQSGPLETHTLVEAVAGEEYQRSLVSCGAIQLEQKIAIVTPESLETCSSEQVGEIWVSSKSVTQGYWNRPAETEATFRAHLAGAGGGPFLRTGDLGFVKDGELYVTGRLKDLIIIRGLNHYPQDIEMTVEGTNPALRRGSGAAFSVEVADVERLVIVQEVSTHPGLDFDGIIENILQAVAEEHEIKCLAVVLIRPRKIPKTSSGKLQRNTCRAMFLAGNLEVVAEWRESSHRSSKSSAIVLPDGFTSDEAHRWLVLQVAAHLGVNETDIGIDQPLTRYGLDSLISLQLTHEIHRRLGVVLNPSFLQDCSIEQLAYQLHRQLTQARCAPSFVQSQIAGGNPGPMSYGQRALWFLQQLSPAGAAYNIAAAVRVRSDLDEKALRRAFQQLVQRHTALRTTFSPTAEGPVQQIRHDVEVSLQHERAETWTESLLKDRLADEAGRPFDLEHGPLLRLILLTRADSDHILLFVVHHIAADFWSLAVLTREMGELYSSAREGCSTTLAPPKWQYSDHARWQADLLVSPEGQRQLEYWLQQLAGDLTALDLPFDHPRPPLQTHRGAIHFFRLSVELTEALKSLSRASAATLYMTLLAAYQALLYRYSLQEDIWVGSPAASRTRAEMADVVGYLANPLVLRANLSGNHTFATFLDQVHQTVSAALAHQDLPFALLVEKLQPGRDPSLSPLFQSMFVMQQTQSFNDQGLAAFPLGESGVQLKIGPLEVESVALDQRTAQFDLMLMMAEIKGQLSACFEYKTDLFEAATIQRISGHLEVFLDGIIRREERSLSCLPLLSAAERQQLLVEWNETDVDYQSGVTIQRLFQTQVCRVPDAVAAVFEEQHLTYGELNRRSNQVAHFLRARGVGLESLVGVAMERSLEMAVGLVGILKADAAFVPLDPAYPRERLAFMLEDSLVSALLTQERLRKSVPPFRGLVICLDSSWPELAGQSAVDLDGAATAGNLAYLIYTSGSTGQPKGALNTHGGISNRLLWMQDTYRLSEADRVLQKTPSSFDVSVWEIFWPMLAGACVVIMRPGGHQDSSYLLRVIAEQQISTIHFVPSMLNSVLREEPGVECCSSLRRVICSGEALPAELQRQFFARSGAELHNLYGPTEAAIDVTSWACDRGGSQSTVPIGLPIANTQIHILDWLLEPVPVGVLGTLYIGGAGLARGYHNRPDQTAMKFVPNPFTNEEGARLYGTGDVGRYQPSGGVEYVGRSDHQVKIRGFRIELAEIEATLRGHPDVRESVVLASAEPAGEKRLVAYLVTRPDKAPALTELRSFVRDRLPEHMIPAAFIVVEAMPLTANGKVDRRALPAPDQSRPLLQQAFVAPRTPIEQVVAGIWARTLGLDQVGVFDHFFELGGHSLLATQITSRVRESLGIDITLAVLFTGPPTVAEMARAIEEAQIKQAETQELDEMLKELDMLSDEEAGILLTREGESARD